MAKSRIEINQDSDIKRGMASKTYKLPTEIITLIEQLAQEKGISQGKVIAEALALYHPIKSPLPRTTP